MTRLEVPAPLPITWQMKDVSSARSSVEELPDGRIEARIDHELIRGVTPEMLVWWFRSFPVGRLEHKGELVSLYRIWHPRDHIRVDMLRRARDGSYGVATGALVAICERIGDRASRVVARVVSMDESGLHLVLRRWRMGPKVGELRHTFEATPEGTLYRSHLVVGSTRPLVGRLVNRMARKGLFTPDVAREWIRHNVEEVGNFQFFLAKMYAQRGETLGPGGYAQRT